MINSTHPRYAGFAGLYRTDPVELAAITFCRVFGGGGVLDPARTFDAVDRTVASLAGLDIATGFLGTTSRPQWEQLQVYVLDCVAIWQQARIAGPRTTGGDIASTSVYFLRWGERLLNSPDPINTLRAMLPASSGEPRPELR